MDAPLLVGTFAARSDYAPERVRATVFTVGASAKLGATSLGAIVGGAWLAGRATGAGLVGIGLTHLVAAMIGVLIAGGVRSRTSGRDGRSVVGADRSGGDPTV
jgi:hypothetical protein